MNSRLDQTTPEGAPFNVFSSEHAANPFPLFAQIRSMGAVVPLPSPDGGDDRQTWMVTRMEEAVRILKDHQHFTVDPRSIGAADPSTPPFFSMASVDEPDHRRLRGLVSKAFTPRYMEGLRPRIQEIADELLDQMQAQGHMDLVEDYAFPLPINVISEMLGVPRQDRAQIRVWSEALVTGANTLTGSDERFREKMQAFTSYTAQLVAAKRQHSADDLISQLIVIEEEGDRLSEEELLSLITVLIFAGHETTSNLIGIGTLTLLDHPDQLERLKADLRLVPSAVEELLRFNGPVIMPTPRFATQETDLAGQHIQKGDLLIIALVSANRDETQFPNPDEVEIARTLNRHLAFGQGIHVCLGAPLARLEGDIAFTTLLKRMPDLRLSVPRESITWRADSNLRGVTALPVSF
jgi:cytochrome P450